MRVSLTLTILTILTFTSCISTDEDKDKKIEVFEKKYKKFNVKYAMERTLCLATIQNCEIKSLVDNDDKHNIIDLIKDGQKLVFRFTGAQCDVCSKAVLEKLDTISKVIGKENIILIGSFLNERDFYLYKKFNKISYNIYSVPFNALGTPLDHIDKPYLFILDSSMTAKSLIIPDRTLTDLMTFDFKIYEGRFKDLHYKNVKQLNLKNSK